jgi:tetratricopeptide (TPR) repeat protein
LLHEQAVEQAASMTMRESHSLRVTRLSEAYLLAGRVADAVVWARHAVDLSYQYKERAHASLALRLHGEIAAGAAPAEAEQAEAHLRQAVALAGELGMRPLVAHCHLGLGTLYQKIGRDEQAQAELVMAAEMYRAMEMTF